MNLVIRRFDFEGRRLEVALATDGADEGLKQLPVFVARCEKLGFVVDFVREVVEPPPVYEFEFDADRRVLDRVSEFALIVGAAAGLDTFGVSRLRLAVYELAVNTVEHATFDGPGKIRLGFATTNGNVDVTYDDNAASFETVTSGQVDIDNKIKKGDKRGLGLFLLAKIASDLAWDHAGGWNRTSFRLARRQASSKTSARRPKMQEFKVDIKPMKAKGVTLVRPVGSIDSATTPVLEGHIESLIDAGQTRIVADLSETDFISSAGIGIFLGTVGKLREKGGDLILMGMSPAVQDVFDLLNIIDYFQTIDGIEDLETAKA